MDCKRMHSALEEMVIQGEKKLPDSLLDVIKKKREEKDTQNESNLDIRWRILNNKILSDDASKRLLSKSVALFHVSNLTLGRAVFYLLSLIWSWRCSTLTLYIKLIAMVLHCSDVWSMFLSFQYLMSPLKCSSLLVALYFRSGLIRLLKLGMDGISFLLWSMGKAMNCSSLDVLVMLYISRHPVSLSLHDYQLIFRRSYKGQVLSGMFCVILLVKWVLSVYEVLNVVYITECLTNIACFAAMQLCQQELFAFLGMKWQNFLWLPQVQIAKDKWAYLLLLWFFWNHPLFYIFDSLFQRLMYPTHFVQGYFQSLFGCIERLLHSLNVKNLVLPAAEEAESIWTNRFGFGKMTPEEVCERAFIHSSWVGDLKCLVSCIHFFCSWSSWEEIARWWSFKGRLCCTRQFPCSLKQRAAESKFDSYGKVFGGQWLFCLGP